MSRQRWLVVAVEVAEQHQGETIWRVRVRSPEKTEPTYLLYVSQAEDRAAPYSVGGCMQVDGRLLEQEEHHEQT